MRCPTALLPLLVALSFSPLSFARAEAHPSRVELAHSKRFSKVLREVPGAQVVERDSTGLAVREGEEKMRLSKRSTVYSGRGTYFEVGLGACGATSVDSDFMVAMNEDMYGDLNAISSWCFKTISISYGGKTAQATVLDACPGCPYGGLDMSPGLFSYFASESVGVIYMTWTLAGSDPAPTTSKSTPAWTPSSTSTWSSTSVWVAPTTSTTPAWTPSSTSTWSSSSVYTPSSSVYSSSSSSVYSSSTVSSSSLVLNSTSPAALSNGTRGALKSGSSVIPGTAAATGVAGTTAVESSDLPGGNLDRLNQIVIALGGVVGAAAQVAKA